MSLVKAIISFSSCLFELVRNAVCILAGEFIPVHSPQLFLLRTTWPSDNHSAYCLCACVWRRSSDCHGNKSSLFSYTSLCCDIICTTWTLFRARSGIVGFSCFEHLKVMDQFMVQMLWMPSRGCTHHHHYLGIFRSDPSASAPLFWRYENSLPTLSQSFLYFFLLCWTLEKKQNFKKGKVSQWHKQSQKKKKSNFWNFCKECNHLFGWGVVIILIMGTTFLHAPECL